VIARLALRYVLIFAVVLAALSAGAYWFMGVEYRSLLAPALLTPEGASVYAKQMRAVALTIAEFDLPLLALVALASYWLARSSIQPLLDARERERAFAADAAHELRSPLAAIASVAQAARADADEKSAAAFDTIAGCALDASALVGELLTLARAASDQVLACEPVDVGAIAISVSKEFAHIAQAKQLQLQADAQSAIVNGDERRLRELLRNLLENAVRHARSTVRVATSRNGRRVDLLVTNDGAPVEAAERTKIFDRFYKGSGSEAGSGLGLAIVAWIARAHGGEAFVRDAAGAAGTEFVVRLPLFEQ